MTAVQRLFSELQKELVRLGKMPASVTAGSIELNVNDGELASVRPTYYARIAEKHVDSRERCAHH